ncbi:TPA: MFS transporter [Legionella pneumophila]|uniref:Lysosomal dipeptide transporter MFSD1 n=1 Tax=Legionella pneumophila subsp. pneumophila TaxID=91891 RepID=A0AAV2UUK4_LEGPN|nr:MFS transporter [Legionella pneumophila]AMQ27033.1 MFS transporter [Legionella pneumophila subsp. pneumophila]AMV13304.1 putative sulfoacetate transporter SauU [Legionella pneumophila]ANN91638.1 MFS transporter [Legionella pneumophila]MBN5929347.1 MFS transporter [Legionella pneumophila]MCH9061344.1 MFS transporter [Legionella pneumophila serogroup 1]
MGISKVEIYKRKNYLGFAWLVWGLAAAFYFSDYLARVAPGVMHRYLQMDFGINEAGFGILTASFYVPYILMQIPVGLTVDRLSIRWLLTIMSLVTAFGCCVFGLADGLLTASIGRMLIGFSAAFAFICSLRLATSWFPPTMLGLLSGLTQALGMLGAAAGEAPVSFLVSNVGWRHSMLIIAFLFIALSGLLYQFVQDKPGEHRNEIRSVNRISILDSLKIILSNKQTWLNAMYAGFLFGPTAVIGEAIGPAYLQFGRGLGAHAAAFATGLIFIGWGISGPLSGWISDKMGRRKPLMIISAVCGVILSSLFVFIPEMSQTTAYILFFVFGLTNTGVAISYAVSTEIHDRSVVGTSIAFTNMTSIFVGALFQPLVGRIIDIVSGPRAYNVETLLLSDFQAGLKLLPLCSLVALILAFTVKETYCKPIRH